MDLFCVGPLRQPWQDRKAGAEKHGPVRAGTLRLPPPHTKQVHPIEQLAPATSECPVVASGVGVGRLGWHRSSECPVVGLAGLARWVGLAAATPSVQWSVMLSESGGWAGGAGSGGWVGWAASGSGGARTTPRASPPKPTTAPGSRPLNPVTTNRPRQPSPPGQPRQPDHRSPEAAHPNCSMGRTWFAWGGGIRSVVRCRAMLFGPSFAVLPRVAQGPRANQVRPIEHTRPRRIQVAMPQASRTRPTEPTAPPRVRGASPTEPTAPPRSSAMPQASRPSPIHPTPPPQTRVPSPPHHHGPDRDATAVGLDP
ncbi:hypothetical protein JOD54_002020 [Actinokineospora baliensis]|nr:hypothetical protein [Actinokineospora baliensis]